MKKNKIIISVITSVLLVLGMVLPAAAQVEPPFVEMELAPGESVMVEKCVETPEILPLPDIYFMSDTTGSMGGTIEAVSNNADYILAQISGLNPDAQFGVGNYKDFPYDPYAYNHQIGITSDTAAVSAEINNWVADGGFDGPEAQFYALTQIADPGVGWRTGSSRIVVWFGDAPAHDPVPDAATGLGYDIDEETVTDNLVADEVRVIAISLDTGGYSEGTDDDPTLYGGDYAGFYGIIEDGLAGQASRIAVATGGLYLFAADPDDVVDAILAGITNLPITVTPQVEEPCPFLDISFSPPSQTVISGETACFEETIRVLDNAPQCEWVGCVVNFVDENGNVLGSQKIRIHVKDITPPEVWCEESVNPHGENIPPAGSSTMPGPKGGWNEEGFYQLLAMDNCDAEPEVYVGTDDNHYLFGPYPSGIVVKITEAPGAVPSAKPMGSSKGKAGAVSYHIKLPTDPVITAADDAGNSAYVVGCLVPPLPK